MYLLYITCFISALKFTKLFKFKILYTICCSTSNANEAQVSCPQFNVKESISHSDRQVTTVNFLSSVLAIFNGRVVIHCANNGQLTVER